MYACMYVCMYIYMYVCMYSICRHVHFRHLKAQQCSSKKYFETELLYIRERLVAIGPAVIRTKLSTILSPDESDKLVTIWMSELLPTFY